MPDQLLRTLFDKAVAAAQPSLCVPPHLPARPKGRCVVVGAGKASAAMARAVEDHWDGPLEGIVVTRYGYAVACERIDIIEASHPVPDAAGERAAARILDMASGLGADDLLLCLISGGGSALLSAPAAGLTLADKRAVTAALLRSGAPIGDINRVRKHLSAIKGGRLALAAYPAAVVTLAISDVPGDDPGVIASGPTVGEASTPGEAMDILGRHGIEVPDAVRRHLLNGAGAPPRPGDERLAGAQFKLVATPAMALEAAAKFARSAGYAVEILGDAIEGEARGVAARQAALALAGGARRLLLSGGETTVTVRGDGRGGRNAEFLLALAIALDGHPGIWATACDTDGIDGTEDNAGAIIRPDTAARARALGIDMKEFLDNNDGYGFFEILGDLVITGPTYTNVNDFRAIVIDP